MTKRTPEERFWEKVDRNGPIPKHRPELGPCWVWTAGTFKYRGGYGQFQAGTSRQNPKPPVYAHRFAWVLCNGPIPDGLRALHHCDNPPCVKPIADAFGPSHLFLGTQADNAADMARKGRGTGSITAEVARTIKDWSATGMPRQQIADELGVTVPIIKRIRAGKTWRHA
jgi:hypothetical protein